MIRYPVSEAGLRRDIEKTKPGWLSRAAKRSNKLRKLGRYREKSSIWSDVKPVYIRLQGESKCAYCERKMESVNYGKGEQDVEHFRPKGSVREWDVSEDLRGRGLHFAPVPPGNNGYYRLAYHIFNYAAACKPCNSALKKNGFPIAGTYRLEADDLEALKDEEAYLIYPLGDMDEDPEELIEFHGVVPRPIAARGHRRNRALVTIDFFKLGDPDERENLFMDRARIITALYPLLRTKASGGAGDADKAVKTVASGHGRRLPHLNCARSFIRLFGRVPEEAESIYKAALRLVFSGS